MRPSKVIGNHLLERTRCRANPTRPGSRFRLPWRPLMAVRRFVLIVIFIAGCSTHPISDTCDYFRPGHLYPNKVGPYGGVCIPQGVSFQGTAPGGPLGPLIPPPVPLPPSTTGPGPAISLPTYPNAGPIPVPNLPPPNLPR
jgi:hypothetical protein